MTPLRVLDLFSGIGGFSLGLERTGGFRTVAFCEIDHYCRAVLAKHWSSVPAFRDVRFLTAEKLRRLLPIDVICGGFPCQDITLAGKGAGIDGEQSGLWREFARISGELRPKFIFVENSAALLGRGLGRILGDLAALGYDAEWHCIPAAAAGAHHLRDRIWIVAYPNQAGRTDGQRSSQVAQFSRYGAALHSSLARYRDQGWGPEPAVDRMADGVPARLDRVGALGNAVTPILPQAIGQAVLETIASQ